jgi:hypothetical protein
MLDPFVDGALGLYEKLGNLFLVQSSGFSLRHGEAAGTK